MTKVIFSIDYFKAITKLTPNEQSLVNKTVIKFHSDPRSPSLNFEKLTGCKDDKLCSIRASRSLRIIIASICKDQHILLHVDNHDKAYEWANGRRLDVNPYTGVLQCYAIEESNVPSKSLSESFTTYSEHSPFSGFRDRQLLAMGVPEANINSVRRILTESDLERALDDGLVPQEAYYGLFMLLAGSSYEEAYRECVINKPVIVDTDNFVEALNQPQSQASFNLAESEHELKIALNQSLESWRTFLHPSQRKLVSKHWPGPTCVLGAAGTGKTVVAIHRAKWLVNNVIDLSEKLLIVTFNANLAVDINSKIKSFILDSDICRIDVSSIDSLALSFLRKKGILSKVIFDNDLYYESLWSRVLKYAEKFGLPDSFFREEWSSIIQPLRISNKSDYLKVDRSGRGVALNRMQRAKIWPIFEKVIRSIQDNNLLTINDALYLAAELAFKLDISLYRSILVDEAQDMSVSALRFIRSLAKPDENDLLFFGDPRQNIYMQGFAFRDAGIDISNRIENLYINYRTSSNIQEFADRLLYRDLFVSSVFNSYLDSKCKSLFSGVPVVVKGFDTLEKELFYLLEMLADHRSVGLNLSDICVACRTNSIRDKVSSFLEDNKIKTYLLSPRGDERDIDGVRLSTFHRLKGLEFQSVFLFGCGSELIPPRQLLESTSDPVELCKIHSSERFLAYVAATRAREKLFITYTGDTCAFMKA